jgi:hypothetical protein
MPDRITPSIMRVERALEPLLGKAFAFRMMLVIEKVSAAESSEAQPLSEAAF